MSLFMNAASKVWKVIPREARTWISRRLHPSFTVSAAGIITNDKGEVLLLNHYLRPNSGWGVPGGFIDHSEQFEDALRREIREETTLELSDVKLFRFRTLRSHIEVYFTAKAVGEAKVSSREISELRWFKVDEIPGEMGLDQQFIIRKALGVE